MTIEEKYKIHYVNGKRYYEVDMTDKEPSLENVVPYLFQYRGIQVQKGSWNRMTIGILTELDRQSPKSDEYLLSLKYYWSKTDVFSREKQTNFSPFRDLFLNTNHTSTHALMNIQRLLEAYDVRLNECFMLVRRHPVAEPKEAQEFFTQKTRDGFLKCLQIRQIDGTRIIKIMKNMPAINQWLNATSKTFISFYLLDDYATFFNCQSRVLSKVAQDKGADSKTYNLIKTYLSYFGEYIKNRDFYDFMLTAKINPELKKAIGEEINHLLQISDHGIITAGKLYSRLYLSHDELLDEAANFNNTIGIYELANCYYGDKYKFNPPFISSKNAPSLTNKDLILSHIYSMQSFSIEDVNRYCTKNHIKKSITNLEIAEECADSYVQVSENNFVSKDLLGLSDGIIEAISKEISYGIEINGSLDISQYKGYQLLPCIEYPWNEFLLLGITRSYLNNTFDIIRINDQSDDTHLIVKKRKLEHVKK